MNIPTIGGTRGIFEIFVPGVFLLLNITLAIYLFPLTDDATKAQMIAFTASPVLSLSIIVVFGYLIGVLLRLSRAESPDRWSSRYLRSKLWLQPRVKTWIRLKRFDSKSRKANDRLILYTHEEFPYIRWIGVVCQQAMPADAHAFYRKFWAKRKGKKHNRQFFNFCKVIINSTDDKSAKEIYAAEALSRYIAGMFYALVIAFLILAVTEFSRYMFGLERKTILDLILVSYLFAIRSILRHYRILRIKEVEIVFVASFRNKSAFEASSQQTGQTLATHA